MAFSHARRKTSPSTFSKKSRSQSRSFEDNSDSSPRTSRTSRNASSERSNSRGNSRKSGFSAARKQSRSFEDDKPRPKGAYASAKSSNSADSFAKDRKSGFSAARKQSRSFEDDKPRPKRAYASAKSSNSADSFAKDRKSGFSAARKQSRSFEDDKPRPKRVKSGETNTFEGRKADYSQKNSRVGETRRPSAKSKYIGVSDVNTRYSSNARTAGNSQRSFSKQQTPQPKTISVKPQPRSAEISGVTEKKKSSKSQSTKTSTLQGTRINKYLADSGVASRRAVEELIVNGEVKVNRKIVTDLAARIMPGDFVTVKGEPVTDVRRMVYILLNKPKDVITTADDEFGRKTVLDLIKTDKRLFPVGRLDRNTTGVLLLTNDGELAHRLTHPSYQISRVYNVTLNAPIDHTHAKQISRGVILDDGEETQPCEVFVDPLDGKKLIIELREGKNREVRRIFEKFGYDVRKLDRKFFATLSTRGLARGKYRVLTRRELSELRQLTGLEE